MHENKLKLAVMRFGYWGKNLVRNFHDLSVLQMICDIDPARGQLVKENYPDVEFCSAVKTVLDDDRIKAVAIATAICGYSFSNC